MATAFINPDKSIVSIVLNKNNESLKYKVYLKNQMRELEIPARSMQTIIFK
jgi:O-glycosyl hydrolase